MRNKSNALYALVLSKYMRRICFQRTEVSEALELLQWPLYFISYVLINSRHYLIGLCSV